ncbi:MAG: hypothetical protein ACFFBP_05165 [Promethearchaeota archaeon]
MEIIFLSVQILLVIIRALIGTAILFHAKKNRIKNLYLLSIYFYGEAFNYIIFTVSTYLSIVMTPFNHVILVLFISTALFKDKKNPLWILLIILIPTSIIQLTLGGLYYLGINSHILVLYGTEIFNGINLIIVHGSISYALIGPYRKIRHNQFVEPRIKTRYLLIILSEISYGFMGVIYPFYAVDRSAMVAQIILSIFIFLNIISQSLAWIQPKGLKKWLNRNYNPEVEKDELSEDEIMKSFMEG